MGWPNKILGLFIDSGPNIAVNHFHKFGSNNRGLCSFLRIGMFSNQRKGENDLSSTDPYFPKRCPIPDSFDIKSHHQENSSNSDEERLYLVNPDYAISIQNCPKLEKLREDVFVWMVQVYMITECNQ